MSATALPLAAASAKLRGRPGRPRKPIADQPAAVVSPRLLDIEAASAYLAVSGWTLRDLVSSGTIPRVRVPLPGGGELRRVLVDREDLDRLIAVWKEAAR